MIEMNFKKSVNWTNNEEHNIVYLRGIERYFNDVIKIRGYIYLNQIYEALGLWWDPDKENLLFKRGTEYHPGRFLIEYFHGSELLLIHDLLEEES